METPMAAASMSICILGAGGHGRVVADVAEMCGYGAIEFVDAKWPDVKANLVWPVIGRGFANARAGFQHFVALGNNGLRLKLVQELMAAGQVLPTLVHPSASVSKHATLGQGCVVMAGAVINAGTRVGHGVIVNTTASIDHDCVIGDGVHISPGAHLGGTVEVGAESWIGLGAGVREGIRIGPRCLVAAGAMVIADLEAGVRAQGVPARAFTK
jgi:sugar O-acyltransferase (sialic acid O-acetyltransferase NeuD family)